MHRRFEARNNIVCVGQPEETVGDGRRHVVVDTPLGEARVIRRVQNRDIPPILERVGRRELSGGVPSTCRRHCRCAVLKLHNLRIRPTLHGLHYSVDCDCLRTGLRMQSQEPESQQL